MARSIAFLNRETGNPVHPIKIDELICADRGTDVHPTEYCEGWYRCIGERLSYMTVSECREKFKSYIADPAIEFDAPYYSTMLEILSYLDRNYEVRSW